MYDAATLDDIQMRLRKGWVIRKDETQMLLNMATELLVRTASSPTPSFIGTEEQIRAALQKCMLRT